jgi:hypothetical protein
MRLSKQSLKLVTVFKEAGKDLKFFFFYFTRQPENLKPLCAYPESTDLYKPSIKKYSSGDHSL